MKRFKMETFNGVEFTKFNGVEDLQRWTIIDKKTGEVITLRRTADPRTEGRQRAMGVLAENIESALTAQNYLADGDDYAPVKSITDELTVLADCTAKNLFSNAAHEYRRACRNQAEADARTE